MISAVSSSQSRMLQKQKLENACEEFEAFFYNAILKSARSGGVESELIKKSEGEKTFTEMLDYELSKVASKNSKGGIKELLINFLGENYSDTGGKKCAEGYKLTGKTGKNFPESLA